jgi:threonine 3-dehydrogenase
MGNAVHTALEGMVAGNTVFVIGCGPIGCFAVGVAKAAGASKVIASDFSESRRELARKMGADTTLTPAKDDVVGRVRELSGTNGVDMVLEMSGHPAGHTQAFESVRLGGRINFLGTPAKNTDVNFAKSIIFKGLTLYGVTGRKMYDTWEQMFTLLRGGKLDPRPVVTHRFPMEGMAEAMQLMKDGKSGKVILEI